MSESSNSKPLQYIKPKNEKSKFNWSETRNSNLFYFLSLKTRKANLFRQKLEIQTSFYFMPKNEKSKFIWSETRNSNLFYILSLKTRKAYLFGQKLEIQTSFIL